MLKYVHGTTTTDCYSRPSSSCHPGQGRFSSVVMDEQHLAHAVRYVSLNPVRAKLVDHAQNWKWSSVDAHLSGYDDRLVTVAPVLERYGDFALFLSQDTDNGQAYRDLRRAEMIDRPLGSDKWIQKLEKLTGRQLKPRKRGPKKKDISRRFSVFSKLSP